MQNQSQSVVKTHNMNNHDMSYHDICNDTCYDNTSTTCNHDMSESFGNSERLSKTDWWYLVNTLESWRVFSPRSVVKKNPQLAWRIMNICKDAHIRVKGAYFTTCFKRELYKLENEEKLAYWRSVARQKLGIV